VALDHFSESCVYVSARPAKENIFSNFFGLAACSNSKSVVAKYFIIPRLAKILDLRLRECVNSEIGRE
jgi:hypothetical protein